MQPGTRAKQRRQVGAFNRMKHRLKVNLHSSDPEKEKKVQHRITIEMHNIYTKIPNLVAYDE